VIDALTGLANLQIDHAGTVAAMALRKRDDGLAQLDVAIQLTCRVFSGH
jgi:hypothetical protein